MDVIYYILGVIFVGIVFTGVIMFLDCFFTYTSGDKPKKGKGKHLHLVKKHIKKNYSRYKKDHILISDIEEVLYDIVYESNETMKMRKGIGIASENATPDKMYDFIIEIDSGKYVTVCTHLVKNSVTSIYSKEDYESIIAKYGKYKYGSDLELVGYTSCFNQAIHYARCINDVYINNTFGGFNNKEELVLDIRNSLKEYLIKLNGKEDV